MTAILLWEGRLNNARLRALFGLGKVRASEWIREFRARYPGWTAWDTKTRSFHATAAAYHAFQKTDGRLVARAASLNQYLTLVGLPHSSLDSAAEHGLSAAYPDLSVPDPKIFAVLSEGIHHGRAVKVVYRSMQNPEPHPRIIAPHNLVRAGRRWHVRAYCTTRQGFRDYALGRIVAAELLGTEAEKGAQEDVAWTTKVRVRLVAHPGMTPQQEDVIRFEYFGNTAARVETCRAALVGYFIQDIRAATDTQRQRPPDYQLAVANLEEVKPWLFPA